MFHKMNGTILFVIYGRPNVLNRLHNFNSLIDIISSTIFAVVEFCSQVHCLIFKFRKGSAVEGFIRFASFFGNIMTHLRSLFRPDMPLEYAVIWNAIGGFEISGHVPVLAMVATHYLKALKTLL